MSNTKLPGMIKTTDADYGAVKDAIKEIAKSFGKNDAAIDLTFTELETDGDITKTELEKSVYDVDGKNGYSTADYAVLKSKMPSASNGTSAISSNCIDILKRYGLAPTNITTVKTQKTTPVATAGETDGTLQTVTIRGVQYTNVKNIEYYPGRKDVKTLEFASPQTVKFLNLKEYSQVSRVTFSAGGMESEIESIQFATPQTIEVARSKYCDVVSLSLNKNNRLTSNRALYSVSFSTPQSIEVGRMRYDSVESMSFTENGDVCRVDFSTTGSFVIGGRVYNGSTRLDFNIEDGAVATVAEAFFSPPQSFSIGGAAYESVERLSLFPGGTLYEVFLSIPQSFEIGGKKYECVNRLRFTESGDLADVGFSTPQNVEIEDAMFGITTGEKIYEGVDGVSFNENGEIGSVSFSPPQDVEVGGEMYRSVEELSFKQGTVVGVIFSTPQTIEVRGETGIDLLEGVKRLSYRPYDRRKEFYFSTPQSIEFQGRKYEHVSSLVTYKSYVPHDNEVIFSYPQTIEIGGKKYKDVAKIFISPRSGGVKSVSFFHPQSIEIGGKIYENVRQLEFNPDETLAEV